MILLGPTYTHSPVPQEKRATNLTPTLMHREKDNSKIKRRPLTAPADVDVDVDVGIKLTTNYTVTTHKPIPLERVTKCKLNFLRCTILACVLHFAVIFVDINAGDKKGDTKGKNFNFSIPPRPVTVTAATHPDSDASSIIDAEAIKNNTLHDLIYHASDTQIQPIILNKKIEVIEDHTFDAKYVE